MPPDDLTAIKVATARIEEQVKALCASTQTQHEHISQQIDRLAGKETVADLEDRIRDLENTQGWVVKGVVGTAFTAIAGLTGLTKKIGL